MRHGHIQRDETAVSAAVATVLLFGGVLSIIGLMMVSMMPVIDELEGSVERHDMSAQMTLLAHETSELSERGMPGDSATATLVPVDGQLVWDSLRGGMWYSATWKEDMSLRARGMLDFDDTMEIRHPESRIESVCLTDLRLGPDRPYLYTLEAFLDKVTVTTTPGLAVPLGPIELRLHNGGTLLESIQLRVDDMVTLDLTERGEVLLSSSHALTVLGFNGESGATYVHPNAVEPSDKRGQAWSVPMPAGDSVLHLLSQEANQIHVTMNGETSVNYAVPTGLARTAVSFTHRVELTEPTVVHVTSSTPSRMLILFNASSEAGLTAWPAMTGAYIGHAFLPPHLNGTLRLINPTNEVVTATWRGGGVSIAAGGHEHLTWPPDMDQGAALIDADGDLMMQWAADPNSTNVDEVAGTMMVPASDTGGPSGGSFVYFNVGNQSEERVHLQLAGYTNAWNASGVSNATGTLLDTNRRTTLILPEGTTDVRVESGHPLRMLRTSGDLGAYQVPHDGEQRCTRIDTQASGWITTDVPWERMGGRGVVDVEQAWRDGRHPASLSVDVYGSDGTSSHANLGTVWAFHLSRLTYEFSSSINGMEVAFSGGAVVTNHPEFRPYVVVPPSDRGGPGPRFAATVPSLHPTIDSESGGGTLELDIELVHRQSLASTPAYEVRRGWSEPYGTAIADSAGVGLEASEDWTVYPGRLDLLTDYVGWVPDPSYGTAEAVWHTNGEAIEFTLQLTSLDVTTREALI